MDVGRKEHRKVKNSRQNKDVDLKDGDFRIRKQRSNRYGKIYQKYYMKQYNWLAPVSYTHLEKGEKCGWDCFDVAMSRSGGRRSIGSDRWGREIARDSAYQKIARGGDSESR